MNFSDPSFVKSLIIFALVLITVTQVQGYLFDMSVSTPPANFHIWRASSPSTANTSAIPYNVVCNNTVK